MGVFNAVFIETVTRIVIKFTDGESYKTYET